MDFYKVNTHENGDILLEKVIIDNTNYIIIDKENGNKLLQKIKSIFISDVNINDIKKYEFGKSIILSCIIDENEIKKLKYKSIINIIYKIINDGTKIIKQSKLNIKTIEKVD